MELSLLYELRRLVSRKLIDGFQFYEIITALSKPKTEIAGHGCQLPGNLTKIYKKIGC